jgi:AbrB family looped-hinge helix DNA binding protein
MKRITYTVKMQKGGRLTVPAPIRRLLNINVGDLLLLKLWRGKILVTPQTALTSRPISVKLSPQP